MQLNENGTRSERAELYMPHRLSGPLASVLFIIECEVIEDEWWACSPLLTYKMAQDAWKHMIAADHPVPTRVKMAL